MRVHGRDYKNRSDFNGERDTDEDSLDGFIVKDSLADRYVHRPDLSPEDEFSCATGFTGDELNENDRKNDNGGPIGLHLSA